MKRKFAIGLLKLILSFGQIAYAGNVLQVTRSTNSSFDVILNNTDVVAGLQFSIHTSSDIILNAIQPGSRTAGSDWTVSSYKPNDSTLNVVVLSMTQRNFNAASGSIVTVSFQFTPQLLQMSSIELHQVLAANPSADSVGVTVKNLHWNNTALADGQPFVFGQNYPNPFNPTTQITYRLNKAAQVNLTIYDVAGREIRCLVNQYQSPGDYRIEWNSTSPGNRNLASGMYFARLTVDNQTATRKLVMMK